MTTGGAQSKWKKYDNYLQLFFGDHLGNKNTLCYKNIKKSG